MPSASDLLPDSYDFQKTPKVVLWSGTDQVLPQWDGQVMNLPPLPILTPVWGPEGDWKAILARTPRGELPA